MLLHKVAILSAVVILAIATMLTLQRSSGHPATVLSSNSEVVLLGLINDYRAENGLHPVVIEGKLQAAAEWMAHDMVTNNYASHTDSLGRYTPQRLTDFGYTEPWLGEVIALGIPAESEVLRQWKRSPEHNKALLGDVFRTAGVALVEEESGTYSVFWVVTFGVLPSPIPAPTATLPPALSTVTPVSASAATPDSCSP